MSLRCPWLDGKFSSIRPMRNHLTSLYGRCEMMFLTMSGVRASSMSKGSQQRVCMLPKAVILYSPMSVPKTLFCRNQLACLHKRTKIRRRSAQGTRSIEKQFQVVQQQLAKTIHPVTICAGNAKRIIHVGWTWPSMPRRKLSLRWSPKQASQRHRA